MSSGYAAKSIEDIHSLVKDIYKETLETILEAELEAELGYSRYDYRNKKNQNSRNGKRAKTVRSSAGEFELAVPRDHNGEFEPEIVSKGSQTVACD